MHPRGGVSSPQGRSEPTKPDMGSTGTCAGISAPAPNWLWVADLTQVRS